MVDTTAIEQFALRLMEGLREGYDYHNWEHTLNVMRRAVFYAGEERISQEELRLLQAASLFHDTGFTRVYDGHEASSIQIARESLPTFGYSPQDVDTIAGMILATRNPQTPRTRLEEILCDADMDNLGRKDFFKKGDALRRELKVICGLEYDDEQWRRSMLELLRSHTYFTPSAREHRDPGKAQNLRDLAG